MYQVSGLSGTMSIITFAILAIVLIVFQFGKVTPLGMNVMTALTYLPFSLPVVFAGNGVFQVDALSGDKLKLFMALFAFTFSLQIFLIPDMARRYQVQMLRKAHIPMIVVAGSFLALGILQISGIRLQINTFFYNIYIMDYPIVLVLTLVFWDMALKDWRARRSQRRSGLLAAS